MGGCPWDAYLPTPDAPAQLTWLVCQGAFPGMVLRTVDCSRGGPALWGRRVLRPGEGGALLAPISE